MTAGHASIAAPSVHAAGGELLIVQLGKTYQFDDKSLQVLADINLQVQAGEFISIVGPSGCGKSTLLRLIVGLDTDYAGGISLDGKRLTGTGLDRGMVFQDHRLLPWKTVEENIALALNSSAHSTERRQAIVAEYIGLVKLQGFERAYPRQLSGGMAQRAAIARALVNHPKVLLLDEPLGALDALTRLHLQKEMQRIWMQHRSTVLMVTHDVEEAVYLADRVVVMDASPGRIKRIVSVNLNHPRERGSPELRRIEDDILADLMNP